MTPRGEILSISGIDLAQIYVKILLAKFYPVVA